MQIYPLPNYLEISPQCNAYFCIEASVLQQQDPTAWVPALPLCLGQGLDDAAHRGQLSLCQSVGAKEIYTDQKLLPKAWRDVWCGCRGRYSRAHKDRCYKIIKGTSRKCKLQGFFYAETSLSALQLSLQNSSRGGSLWSCLRTASFLLHPPDPPLPSLLRQSEVISPSEKLMLETKPSICSRTWGVRWNSFLT